ncbi:MAG: hypothetical protein NVS2B9_06390 [Myxococcales bacterium]
MTRARRPRAGPGAALAAAGAAAGATFAFLAWAVAAGRVEGFDGAAFLLIQRLPAQGAGSVLRVATRGGSSAFVLAVVVVAGLFQVWRGRPAAAVQLAVVVGAGELANLLLKQIFHRLRPPHAQLESFAFPSGHAMTAVVTYGMLALLAARADPRFRLPAALGAAGVALLIGASRVYLGLHWASDVVAGFAAGVVVLAVAAGATRPGLDPGGPC